MAFAAWTSATGVTEASGAQRALAALNPLAVLVMGGTGAVSETTLDSLDL